jgi:hypothetical protein
MIVNRSGLIFGDIDSEEIFDADDDFISEEDFSDEVISPNLQDNSGLLITQTGNILVDPHVSVDDKFKILTNVLIKADQEFQKNKQEKDQLKHKVTQLTDAFIKIKDVYEEKLNDQEELNAKLQEQLDELSIKDEREEWIANNVDKGAVYIAGTGLGIAGGFAVTMGTVASGITGIPVLPILGASALKGISVVREIEQNNLRNALKNLEEKYLEQNPDGSKKEAFDYAKNIIEEQRKNFDISSIDDGTTPDVSY